MSETITNTDDSLPVSVPGADTEVPIVEVVNHVHDGHELRVGNPTPRQPGGSGTSVLITSLTIVKTSYDEQQEVVRA